MTAGPIDLDALDELLRRCLEGDTPAALDVRVQVAALAELLTPATGAPIDTVQAVLRDALDESPLFAADAVHNPDAWALRGAVLRSAEQIVARLGLTGDAAATAGCTP